MTYLLISLLMCVHIYDVYADVYMYCGTVTLPWVHTGRRCDCNINTGLSEVSLFIPLVGFHTGCLEDSLLFIKLVQSPQVLSKHLTLIEASC